ncbi:MAG: hypothetical protein QM305_08895 [Bacteroidota bacterium]|jgi:hypothetical protein|nr:hypothetical protein [Bacteroidota bacterium]
MEYSVDLLSFRTKSKFVLILGILLLLFAIGWFIAIWIRKGSASLFDWIFFILLILNGVVQTSYGLGNPIERLFGKAFVRINSQAISIKTGIFDKKQTVKWSDIRSISYKPANFVITKKNKSTCKLSMSKLDYSVIQDIKRVMNNIANDKNIPTNLDS